MIRGEREIALTTPVSLTAFQPSLWDGSSLLPFQAFHAWLRSQVPTGQSEDGIRTEARFWNRRSYVGLQTECKKTTGSGLALILICIRGSCLGSASIRTSEKTRLRHAQIPRICERFLI
jgi:hypothetical protein